MQSAHDEQHVDCRTCWAKAALLFWEYPLGLAVVTEAGRDHFQEFFALAGNERNPSVVVAVRIILLFMEDFDGGMFPLLGDVSRFHTLTSRP